MVNELVKIGFELLHLHRISLGVYDKNEAAIRCYRNCGFRTDGILRDIQKYKDGYWSLMEMSILEHEWNGSVSNDLLSGRHILPFITKTEISKLCLDEKKMTF